MCIMCSLLHTMILSHGCQTEKNAEQIEFLFRVVMHGGLRHLVLDVAPICVARGRGSL